LGRAIRPRLTLLNHDDSQEQQEGQTWTEKKRFERDIRLREAAPWGGQPRESAP